MICLESVKSKVKLQRKLQDSRLVDGARNDPEGVRCRNIPPWSAIAWVVGEVEELRPEVEVFGLRHVEPLPNREIPVPEARSTFAAISRITKSPRSRKHVRANVQPAIRSGIVQFPTSPGESVWPATGTWCLQRNIVGLKCYREP